MHANDSISRRRFMGGLAATVGYLGMKLDGDVLAQSSTGATADAVAAASRVTSDEYDKLAKLCFNENPYGPTLAVIKAMTQAFKYANRYGYPDPGLIPAIAALHGVKPENVLLGAGSTELLEVTASAFLAGHKKVVGVEPTFGTVYEYATGLQASAIRLPLRGDYRQDIAAILKAANDNAREVGFVYVCNPNNPTGLIVTQEEVRQLLDGLPAGIPVLMDEAYHHFVEDPKYASSTPFVLEGRPVIVARTFSKIAALAGMRLGYAIAPAPLIERMRFYAGAMHISAVTKFAGVAALKDTAAQAEVRRKTLALRKQATAELTSLGFKVLPSEANYFMVDIRRPVTAVSGEFRKRGILIGRPFPPMDNFLRVSVGDADEMARFSAAFKEIVKS